MQSNSNFEFALKHTLEMEGGWSDHKNDSGGKTMYGITIGTLSRYLGRPATYAEIRNLTLDTAKNIYHKFYWNPCKLYLIDNKSVAAAIFDQAVNGGNAVGIKLAQKSVGVNQDGIMGPKTLAALNNVDPEQFCLRMSINAADRYRSLCRWPWQWSQRVFLKGWLYRADKLKDLPYG